LPDPLKKSHKLKFIFSKEIYLPSTGQFAVDDIVESKKNMKSIGK